MGRDLAAGLCVHTTPRKAIVCQQAGVRMLVGHSAGVFGCWVIGQGGSDSRTTEHEERTVRRWGNEYGKTEGKVG